MTVNKNNKYRLSIQFALDGFSFLVYNQHELRIVEEKKILYTAKDKFHDWLKVKLASEKAFREQYISTSLLYSPEKYTLVPKNFSDPTKQKQLFSISFPLEETEMIETEEVGKYTMLSTITADTYNLLNDYFPNAKWKTSPSFLLENIRSKKEWNVGVLILYKQLHLIIEKEDKVQLSNNFNFRTKADLLYYMLYVFDNLEIPIAQSSIQLLGNQNYLNLLKEELSRYHPSVYVAKRPDGIATKTPMGNLLLSNV